MASHISERDLYPQYVKNSGNSIEKRQTNQCKNDQKKKNAERDFLVAQWLRIRLPMQGTQVQALVWEDPTCRRATKPVHHNY